MLGWMDRWMEKKERRKKARGREGARASRNTAHSLCSHLHAHTPLSSLGTETEVPMCRLLCETPARPLHE